MSAQFNETGAFMSSNSMLAALVVATISAGTAQAQTWGQAGKTFVEIGADAATTHAGSFQFINPMAALISKAFRHRPLAPARSWAMTSYSIISGATHRRRPPSYQSDTSSAIRYMSGRRRATSGVTTFPARPVFRLIPPFRSASTRIIAYARAASMPGSVTRRTSDPRSSWMCRSKLAPRRCTAFLLRCESWRSTRPPCAHADELQWRRRNRPWRPSKPSPRPDREGARRLARHRANVGQQGDGLCARDLRAQSRRAAQVAQALDLRCRYRIASQILAAPRPIGGVRCHFAWIAMPPLRSNTRSKLLQNPIKSNCWLHLPQ